MNINTAVNTAALREQFEAAWQDYFAREYDARDPLHEVIQYVAAGRGKRARAMLAMLSAQACGGDPRAALPAALAVEMMHAYSLVHDDLPCLDNDALRRGRATAHVAYSDARALLAGDALLTDCFAILSNQTLQQPLKLPITLSDEQCLRMVNELTAAGGGKGMVQGQMLDVWYTGKQILDHELITRIHSQKTGALIGAACAMGAIAADADRPTTALFRNFGISVGLAFQVVDDLLDNFHATGKSSGKDREQGKLSFAAVMSERAARDFASSCTLNAKSMLKEKSGLDLIALFALVDQLLERTY